MKTLTSTPNKLPLVELHKEPDGSVSKAAFAKDVEAGLSKKNKTLSSRYFYDSRGSQLFQDIMALPEYYLTRSEFEVLTDQKEAIAAEVAAEGFFHLIDLGAGDALKTKILLRELHKQKQQFDYVPVDISGHAMQELTERLHHELPDVPVQAVVGEYIQALEWLQEHKSERKVVLFLGSNIGNFTSDESMAFLKIVRSYLGSGDKLLMGMDLRKDPNTILDAYDDKTGVTAAFNLNLLRRINEELGGNFDLNCFSHYATYDPQAGVMRSYLVSRKRQEVWIEAIGKMFSFTAWETIHTENSHKYSLEQAQEMGKATNFSIETVFLDKNQYFADILFAVK
ncbi:L-histidine N(alpha)-methyltransferase [Pontibacter qinzhouensis]|uniref:L-histidine N(Alpha)-methyltransferase n=1 Tax=Pontibacter qinzhouensis TaxID=2603253 RepID=A0A5C8KDV3_9BACT|nr:L-histidine N(alpha)-methyltransferase [Pontibacter qinzhouensis]TXK49840.1 L-histidine N(alpha)-methyltransferase [Pontibacter qinzhouensis]